MRHVFTVFVAEKFLTKTDQCAGALLCRRYQLLVLHFSGHFLLTASSKALKDVNVYFFIEGSNSSKLYQHIWGAF